MEAFKRYPTKYQGVFYIFGSSKLGKQEKIYYIRYYKNGKRVDEPVGRQFEDRMNAHKASFIRVKRIEGVEGTNQEQRNTAEAEKQAQENKWTVSKLWEEYKKVNKIKGIVSDENRFQNYLKSEYGSREPHDISSLDIDRLRFKLLKIRKPATVKNVLELLRRIINFGADRDLCTRVNFRKKMPQVNNERTEFLSPEQLKKLFEVLENESNIQAANLMRMALFTGMRRGELFNLKWTDIDFDRRLINIQAPKGGKDQTIPLNEEAYKILVNHPNKDNGYIFPGRDGDKRTDIKKAINRIKKLAELPKEFRPLHGLRHTYASMLASSGQVDMYVLQKLLTHKSFTMTQRYAHLRDEALKGASNLLGELINQAINLKNEQQLS